MFENLKKQENNIDDIFAETDKQDDLSLAGPETSSERPGASSAGQPLMVKPEIQGDGSNKKSAEDFSDFSDSDDRPKKTLKKLFVVIIILAIIGIIAYFVYAKILAPRVLNDGPSFNQTESLLPPPIVELPSNENIIEESIPPVENDDTSDIIVDDSNDLEILKSIDTDKDGLSDYDEVYVYFTDHFNSDTDADGLSDYDELLIIGTDPLNPDTDGDGYFDGQEIMSCYNPLGDGAIDIRLFINPQSFAEKFPEIMIKCNLIP